MIEDKNKTNNICEKCIMLAVCRYKEWQELLIGCSKFAALTKKMLNSTGKIEAPSNTPHGKRCKKLFADVYMTLKPESWLLIENKRTGNFGIITESDYHHLSKDTWRIHEH